jgi:hypothetical protein
LIDRGICGTCGHHPVPAVLRLLREPERRTCVPALVDVGQFHALRLRRFHGGRVRRPTGQTRLSGAVLPLQIRRQVPGTTGHGRQQLPERHHGPDRQLRRHPTGRLPGAGL